MPAGIQEEIFNNYHIIGGGYRENCTCPFCESGDRERWLYYILKKYTDIFETDGRVLHFAPEKRIEHYIKLNGNIDYYPCDIVAGKTAHIVDITDIQFREDTFDYIISNHVMEHIIDEKKAVSEIKRVLKPKGRWIFSFPICMDIKTYQDDSIVTEEERLNRYGQKDHVRLYGYDYIERFEKYGLKLEVFSPKDELKEKDILRYGLINDDVIIMAQLRD